MLLLRSLLLEFVRQQEQAQAAGKGRGAPLLVHWLVCGEARASEGDGGVALQRVVAVVPASSLDGA